MSNTKESKIKLKLLYGNPMISKLEVDSDHLLLEILIPGVEDKSMVVSASFKDVVVDHEIDSKFIGKFKFVLSSDEFEFWSTRASKENGVFSLSAQLVPTDSYSKYKVIAV